VAEAFLEEIFDKRTSNPVQRLHRPAAMAVLESLLPDAGRQIRERRRTERNCATFRDTPRGKRTLPNCCGS